MGSKAKVTTPVVYDREKMARDAATYIVDVSHTLIAVARAHRLVKLASLLEAAYYEACMVGWDVKLSPEDVEQLLKNSGKRHSTRGKSRADY